MAVNEPSGEKPGGRPDLAEALSEAVRTAALRLPPDRALPLLYMVDPFPDKRPRPRSDEPSSTQGG